ncbi:hypothetical protein X777_03332, partial [Ooceraea biroi]
ILLRTIPTGLSVTSPRAVVIRAANQKLSSEQPTGRPSMQQAEPLLHSLKRGGNARKIRRKGCAGGGKGGGRGSGTGKGRKGREDVGNVSGVVGVAGRQFRLLTFHPASVVLRTYTRAHDAHVTWRTAAGEGGGEGYT